ncbi:hypothetical protein Lalb_Chr16g0384231 [Lupinus albus]|uniref:Uncharacterized protein n=1 Tax=Lupinus albus TaxID=3870 RepID=A0A6A4NU99_LUPAL|nr:hypothetical protein Lalb_Chr16g0384231 [Lupinus albus]
MYARKYLPLHFSLDFATHCVRSKLALHIQIVSQCTSYKLVLVGPNSEVMLNKTHEMAKVCQVQTTQKEKMYLVLNSNDD